MRAAAAKLRMEPARLRGIVEEWMFRRPEKWLRFFARRDLGCELILALEKALRASVAYAREHGEETRGYIRAHAQELEPEVIRRHIELYVNDYSFDLGADGARPRPGAPRM